MSDPTTLVTLASAGTIAIAIAAAAGLRGWHEWLDVRRAQLGHQADNWRGSPIELLELRARVRRLESIASGREV